MADDIAAALRIERVALDTDHLQLTLSNGSEHSRPYRLHSVLQKATSAQRAQWVLVDGGCGIAWPALANSGEAGLINMYDVAWEASYDAAMDLLKEAGWKLDALPSREQDLCALWRLEADMNNGGFIQFFGNWGEANCRIALDALRKIGAHQALAIVQRQRDILQRLEDDPRLESMQDIYRLLTEAESEELEELDQAFWEYPDRLAPLGLACYGLTPGSPLAGIARP